MVIIIQKLKAIDGETLLDMRLEPARFCVETLLPQGICILGGLPKVGKSWLVLDLCIRVSLGQPIWNLKTRKCTTLYLCLEDSYQRIQHRLSCITGESAPDAFFAVSAGTVADGLCGQIEDFVTEHPDTGLIVIDTFQLVRNDDNDLKYSTDYQDIRALKQLADKLSVTILLEHHLRKQGDTDPFNKLSGTTGITGASDATYVLDVENRNSGKAKLICTGRDIEYRELELQFDSKNCRWDLISDSMEQPEILLPPELEKLVRFMREQKYFDGSNSDFTTAFNSFSFLSVTSKSLKQQMNRYRSRLEECGVIYESRRTGGQRYINIRYSSPCNTSDCPSDAKVTQAVPSDASDANDAGFFCTAEHI